MPVTKEELEEIPIKYHDENINIDMGEHNEVPDDIQEMNGNSIRIRTRKWSICRGGRSKRKPKDKAYIRLLHMNCDRFQKVEY